MKTMIQQWCGYLDNEDDYRDWKADQEAVKDVSGFVFSTFELSSGQVTAFYDISGRVGGIGCLLSNQRIVKV